MPAIKRTIKKILRFFGRWYYRTASLSVFWRYRNRQAIKQFRAAPLAITNVGRSIVAELDRCGVAVTRADALLGEALVAELIAYAKSRRASPDVEAQARKEHTVRRGESERAKSFFLVNLWEGPAVLDLTHLFTRFSLDERILGTVAGYLGMWPRFRGWHLEGTVILRTRSSSRCFSTSTM